MPNWNNYFGSEGQPDAIAEIISYKSVSTGPITRGSSDIAAKTGRLETLSSQRQVQGENGKTFTIDAMMLCEFGTGFQSGDRFTIANQTFEVVMVMPSHTDCEQVYLIVRR